MTNTVPGRPTERADAARNRQSILDAARQLLDTQGATHVSLDRVAELAGVGKGTVFRRFGNRTGLFQALLEEQATTIRHAIESGPPPLGPGAPPRQRLRAFATELARLATSNLELKDAHDRACAQDVYDSPTYRRWHAHATDLIRQTDQHLDAEFAAHTLLGAYHADLVRHIVTTQGEARFIANVQQLADKLTMET